MIPAFEQAKKLHASDGAATWIGIPGDRTLENELVMGDVIGCTYIHTYVIAPIELIFESRVWSLEIGETKKD
jgi:hypothetical protein